jgi:membrane protease YdiL (CAAX protease family)
VTSELEQASLPPEGEPGEQPPAVPGEGPRWPAWYAPAAFVSGILAVFIVAAVAQVIVAATGHDFPTSGAGIALGGTLVQDGLLVAAAVVFAARVAPPRPWQFGLRGVPLWFAVKAALVAYAGFWAVSFAYQLIFSPNGKQTVAKDLGADHGGALLVLAAILVIVVAPVCEEFFFRGFFFGALRSRFSVYVAAVIDALVFGAVHFTSSQTLSILPILAFLGFAFCMLYAYTGSILPGIALHALNNSISYAHVVHNSGAVSFGLFAVVIAGCLVAPQALREPATR